MYTTECSQDLQPFRAIPSISINLDHSFPIPSHVGKPHVLMGETPEKSHSSERGEVLSSLSSEFLLFSLGHWVAHFHFLLTQQPS